MNIDGRKKYISSGVDDSSSDNDSDTTQSRKDQMKMLVQLLSVIKKSRKPKKYRKMKHSIVLSDVAQLLDKRR